jgi:hypothetical protein
LGYVGNTPALNYTTFAVQHFTTSATTGYTLDNAVTNENGIALFVNNVRQQPGSSYAYTASGTTLTLSAATTTSDTMYCVFIGKAVQTVNPGAGSVGPSQLATDAVRTAEILDTNVTGAKLNDDAISAQDALGVAPADTDEFLVSDAGVLKRVDYSYIKGITATSFRPNAKPLIINGDMDIAQRSTSVTAVTTEGYKTCDRFKLNGTVSGAELTIIQEALSSGNAYDDGFRTAWRADCTTATAPASGERLELQYKMEAQDCQLFKSGTSNAQKFTLSFWVKSSYTGATTVNLFNGDASSRFIGATYTISVADTWEKKVLNYAADTSSGFNNDNGIGLYIVFGLAGGSNYTSGSTPSAWQTYSDADVYAGGTPALSSNTANDWAVTGVQFEVGEYTSSTIPPFQHESYGDNLARCQRYYYLHAANSSLQDVGVGGYYSSVYIFFNITFPCSMRIAPSLVYVSGTDYYRITGISTTDYFNDILGGGSASTNEANFYNNTQISGTEGGAGFVRTNNTGASIALNAEL